MGDRLSGDGVPGRRGVHPGDAVSAPWDVWDEHDDIALETALATLLRGADLAPEAEQRPWPPSGPPVARTCTGRVPGAGTTGGCPRSGEPGAL